MTKSLLIVESPAKARTISKYLGKDIEVKASVGHIRDLPVNRLGVDIEQDFAPEYVTIDGKQKIINELKKAAQGKEIIYLAPDPDREGEAIAWHVAEALKSKGRSFSRVLFHEITPQAIKEAITHPQPLSTERFESQQARRILDRLVGYHLSPLLWEKVKRGLSAGRVQSVALRIITDREREIFAFRPEEYWSLTAKFDWQGQEFSARLVKKDDNKIDLKTGPETEAVIAALKNAPFLVTKVVSQERKRFPSPAFTTSQLQQAAFNRLKLQPAKTMGLAQQLYEGQEIGAQGAVGLITYMRTDSVRVAQTALDEARQVIARLFGPEFLPPSPLFYKNKKGVQDAHEAIRPTSATRTPQEMKPFISGQLLALYDLIWRRFMASQMPPALIDQTTIDLQAGAYTFRATGSVIKFKGFLIVYDPGEQDEKEVLPLLNTGQTLTAKALNPKQHFTQPPPRFTEATLVKELEENGIGRPSTYATIISTLRDKDYVESKKGVLKPTELGFIVSDLLVANFPLLMNVEFTAGLEGNLDEIEEGRVRWLEVLKGFYGNFENDLSIAKERMLSLKRDGLATDLVCEQCGAALVIKYGRHGPFLSCTRYPDCKNTLDFTRDEQGRLIPVKQAAIENGELCEKCGRPMVMKKGKFGPFLACSGYPDCKNTKPVNNQPVSSETNIQGSLAGKCEKCGADLAVKRSRQGSLFIACTNYPRCKNVKPYPSGVKCPKPGCQGDIVERSSRRGIFYGCSNYPKCRFTLKVRPVNRACPKCGYPFLLEEPMEASSQTKTPAGYICPNKECGTRITAEKDEQKNET